MTELEPRASTESPHRESASVTAVLLIAHGSRRAEANGDLVQLARRIQAAIDYPIVEIAFLEIAAPDILTGAECCAARGANRVLMCPYFLSAGMHLMRDLREARGRLAKAFPHIEFRLGPPLGPHPLLDQLVIERIREAEIGVDSESGTG